MEESVTATHRILAVLLAGAMLLPAAASTAGDDKQLSVYAPIATYSLPVIERAGRDYVGLLEILEPLGRVSSQAIGTHWKIRYNNLEGEFVAGKPRCKVRGRECDLAAPFLLENERGYVPIAALGSLLPRFLGRGVDFHETGRRLFIGEAGIRPSFQLEAGAPPRLLLNFAAPVNPTISNEPGRLRMVFKRDPVVSPPSASTAFDNKAITQATFSEANGLAELDVTATTPLMATFSNGGKTIVVASIPAASVSAAPATAGVRPPAPRPAAPAQGNSTPVSAPSQSPAPAPRRLLAVVDPAHGGGERGAALTDSLAEKDVTLGFARLLRHELELRGFAVQLLRDSDSTLALDQRAGAANTAKAAIYICLHAASQGSGANVYTALLPHEGPAKGVFQPWNTAQAPALPVSNAVAAAIQTSLQKKQFAAHISPASLRPLNNVLMPAVAVELAPGPSGISDLTSASYQQQAAAAIADAVVSMRDQLGAQR